MTRAAVIVVNPAGEVALIERHQTGNHYFLFPGGGVEAGETVAEAAMREADEELGLRVRIERTIAVVAFAGSEQVYLLGSIVSGSFGTGSGEEMGGADFEGHGSYLPVWMRTDQLAECDVRPRAVAQLVAVAPRVGWPTTPVHLTENA